MSESGEFVPDRIMRCPYLPRRQHGDDCSLCHGSGEVPVRAVPSRLRLLPPSDSGGTVVHLLREPFEVRIDRATPWGNPFAIGRDGDRDEVIAKYLEWVLTSDDERAAWVREHVHELHGKTLGCWCAPQACHGNVLLELAQQSLLQQI